MSYAIDFDPRQIDGLLAYYDASEMGGVVLAHDRGVGAGHPTKLDSGETWTGNLAHWLKTDKGYQAAGTDFGGRQITFQSPFDPHCVRFSFDHIGVDTYIYFRYHDADNCFWWSPVDGGLYKRVAGVQTGITSNYSTPHNDGSLAVSLRGADIRIERTGAPDVTVTDADLHDKSGYGFGTRQPDGNPIITNIRLETVQPDNETQLVQLWPDLSGNAHHLAQADQTLAPTYRCVNPSPIPNGKPFISFERAEEWLGVDVGGKFDMQICTLLTVYKNIGANSPVGEEGRILGVENQVRAGGLILLSTSTTNKRAVLHVASGDMDGGVADSHWGSLGLTRAEGMSNLWEDGVLTTSAAHPVVQVRSQRLLTVGPGSSGLHVGFVNGIGVTLSLVYDRALSHQEMDVLYRWYSAKWGTP